MSVSFASEDEAKLPSIISPAMMLAGGCDFNEESVGESPRDEDGDMFPSWRNDESAPQTNLDGSLVEAVPRPKFIGALLDQINDRFGCGEDLYASFIDLACLASKEETASGMAKIKTKLKFHNEDMNFELDFADGDKNSSLVRIFMFYAAIQNPSSATTFSATAVENETMSFFELDKLARDFDLVPRLITKAELKDIWDDFIYINAIRHRAKPISALNFENFQDMFVRMALFAYNKPGMKRMILAVNGFFPSPEEIVMFFCHQLNLADFAAVKAHIMNKGRETQGALNYRSQSESNWRAKEELKIDLRARYLARVTAHEQKKKESALLKSKKNAMPVVEMKVEDSPGKKKGKKKEQQQVQYGLWSALSGDNYDLTNTSRYDVKKSGPKESTTALPENIMDMLLGKTTAGADDDGSVVATSSVAASESSALRSHADTSTMLGSKAEAPAVEVDDTPHTFDEAMAMARKKGTKLPGLANQYSDDLIYVLSSFSLREPEMVQPNIIESGGCFLDCGSLHPDTRCDISLEVTNLMLDICTLDVSAVGFPDENCEIVTYARPLVSGMTRKVSIRFNVGKREGCNQASILVTFITARSRVQMRVPVFMRIDYTTTPRVVANIRTINSLAHKYNGVYKPPSSSFEKAKDENDSLWIKPEEYQLVRRSTHDRPKSREQRNTLLKRVQSLKRLEDKRSAAARTKEPTSKELLASALSDYLPMVDGATSLVSGASLVSSGSIKRLGDETAQLQPQSPTRTRSRTSFFAEGMTVQLHHAPKHLQPKSPMAAAASAQNTL